MKINSVTVGMVLSLENKERKEREILIACYSFIRLHRFK
jgi:hypothetical protein